MINFVIYSPHYDENSGGVLALYSLSKSINSLGYNSVVVNDCLRKGVDLIDEHTFVVYPEIVIGNPLNSKNVVRWQLNKVGVIGGDESSWGDKDIIAYFSENFKSNFIDSQINLMCFEPHLDRFFEKTKDKDIDTCVLFYKSFRYRSSFDAHPNNSFVLDNVVGNMSAVVDVLSRTKVFISYDTDTYYSIIARLCGASSIIIERDGVSKKDFFESRVFFKFGISYGFGMFEEAEDSSDKIVGHLMSLSERSLQTVKNLIDVCQCHLEYTR